MFITVLYYRAYQNFFFILLIFISTIGVRLNVLSSLCIEDTFMCILSIEIIMLFLVGSSHRRSFRGVGFFRGDFFIFLGGFLRGKSIREENFRIRLGVICAGQGHHSSGPFPNIVFKFFGAHIILGLVPFMILHKKTFPI